MEYLIHLAILVVIYGILGVSLNLVVGFTGLLSVTQAAFYGLGAYTTALLLVNFGVNFFLAAIIGMILTAMISFLIGLVLSRFRGDYYALGSFSFNIIIYSVFLNWQAVTPGPLGIPGIARPSLGIGNWQLEFTSNFSFLLLTFVFLLLTFALARW